jgi:GT2 family glycosyltransferase
VSEPRLSVVIATRGRPARLQRLLRSLREQTLQSFEVIVVQDGPDSETEAVLAREQDAGGIELRALALSAQRGPAAARNAGWRAALASLIAFTDDDCVADPGWLQAALAAAEEDPQCSSIIQGRTSPDPAELAASAGLFSRTVSVDSLGPQYETCNIIYPRATLEALGDFDERFGPRPTAEDTDLAWRAIEAGVRTRFASDALVFHAVERLGPRGMLAVAARWGGAVRIFPAHPQLRAILHRGIFWNVWHYLLWRSLLALLGPRWARRMLLTMHLRQLRTRARRGGAGTWAVPYLLVHDAVECWAVARGAVRHRTLVL